jgi:hypothetical protein
MYKTHIITVLSSGCKKYANMKTHILIKENMK